MAAGGAVNDPHSFKKLCLKRFPKYDRRESSENSFWKKFQFPITVKDHAPVTAIHFSSTSPHDYAVTSGSRVQVFSGTTNQVKKTISRFHQVAYSGCFRHDGRLLAAGSEQGVVKVFDGSSRSILRQCKGHSKPSKTVRFSSDGLKLFSGSDDTTVKYWDISTGTCIATLQGHEDYVRRVLPCPSNLDLVASASYDHTFQIWDVRTPTLPVLEMVHGAPVEDVAMFPSGGVCVSCGSHWIRVWDLLARGRLLLSFTNHQKTITALCFDGSSERLFSASLDKQVKVYSVEDYRVVHSMSYPAPILSMAMSPTDTHFVVGMTTKLLNIKHRLLKTDTSPDVPQYAPPRGGTYRYFVRGKTYRPTEEDHVVSVPKMHRLKPYEKFLKTFKYKKALAAALQHQGQGKALIVYSVLQELARRDGLNIALSGLNEDDLYPLLTYLSRHMTKPQFAPLLLDVCSIIADIYGCTLPQSQSTQAMFRVLSVKIGREIQFQKHAFQLLGSLNTILTASVTMKFSSSQSNSNDTLQEHEF